MQEDWDIRRGISRVEGIIADAKIDLEQLYYRKKRWDEKFASGDDTAQTSKTVRSTPTPILSTAISGGPSLSRPTPPIVDDDEVDEDGELVEQEGHDDEEDAEGQERRRLVKLFIRPGHETSPTAQNVDVLLMMADIKRAYGKSFGQQLPVSATYLDCSPLFRHQLAMSDLKWWDKYDKEMETYEGDRLAGYKSCLNMFKGTQGSSEYDGEDRIAMWSWWWHQLHMESKVDSPDKDLMKEIWTGEKARMANLPRKGWISKRNTI